MDLFTKTRTHENAMFSVTATLFTCDIMNCVSNSYWLEPKLNTYKSDAGIKVPACKTNIFLNILPYCKHSL